MELLVVIAIIGILAALLLTAISHAKARAQRIQCANNLHQQGVGLQAYLSSNRGYPTLAANANNDDYGTWINGTWITQIEHDGLGISHPETNYFETGVWCCPSAQWSGKYLKEYYAAFGFKPVYYGYNGFGNLFIANPFTAYTNTNKGLGLGGQYIDVHKYIPVNESEILNPSDMMAIGDSLTGSYFF